MPNFNLGGMLISKADATKYLFDPAEVCGHPALFCDEHIRQSTVPEDMRVYEMRHDAHGNPKSVEMRVNVSFYGAILVNEPLNVDYGHEICLQDGDFRFMDGERVSLAEFRVAHPPGERVNHV